MSSGAGKSGHDQFEYIGTFKPIGSTLGYHRTLGFK